MRATASRLVRFTAARAAPRALPAAARSMGTIATTLDGLAAALPDKEALHYPVQARADFGARRPPRASRAPTLTPRLSRPVPCGGRR